MPKISKPVPTMKTTKTTSLSQTQLKHQVAHQLTETRTRAQRSKPHTTAVPMNLAAELRPTMNAQDRNQQPSSRNEIIKRVLIFFSPKSTTRCNGPTLLGITQLTAGYPRRPRPHFTDLHNRGSTCSPSHPTPRVFHKRFSVAPRGPSGGCGPWL